MTAPFSPEQESRIREIVREELSAPGFHTESWRDVVALDETGSLSGMSDHVGTDRAEPMIRLECLKLAAAIAPGAGYSIMAVADYLAGYVRTGCRRPSRSKTPTSTPRGPQVP